MQTELVNTNNKNNMRELKCPKCGSVFSVDEADYASIVSQVKGAEFDAEVDRRIDELSQRQAAEEEARTAKVEKDHQSELSKKDTAISEKDAEIARLKDRILALGDQQKLAVQTAEAKKDKEIADLKAAVNNGTHDKEMAVLKERQQANEAAQAKDAEIAKLRSQAELAASEASLREKQMKDEYELKLQAVKSESESRLRIAEEEVQRLKDFKTRLSTKMVGESLEQREAGLTMAHISYQVRAALAGIDTAGLRRCIIAYEPIWAIGTGKTATAEQAEEVCGEIRSIIREVYGARPARSADDGAYAVLKKLLGLAVYIKVGFIVISSALGVADDAKLCTDIGKLGCGDLTGICALVVAGNILRTAGYLDLLARSYHSGNIDCRNAQHRLTGLCLGKQGLEFLDKGLDITHEHIHLPIARNNRFSVLGIHGMTSFLICQAGRQHPAAPVLQGTQVMRRRPWKYASSYLQSRAFRQPRQSLRRRLWL